MSFAGCKGGKNVFQHTAIHRCVGVLPSIEHECWATLDEELNLMLAVTNEMKTSLPKRLCSGSRWNDKKTDQYIRFLQRPRAFGEEASLMMANEMKTVICGSPSGSSGFLPGLPLAG